LDDVIEATLKATWYAPTQHGFEGLTQFTVEDATLDHLLALAASTEASPQAAAQAKAEAEELKTWLKQQTASTTLPQDTKAHDVAAAEKIESFEKDPTKFKAPPALEAPPGQPIGDDEDLD
jgi:hypothetical protein